LHYGVLTDFRDALEETLSEGEPRLRPARQSIEELNEKYGSSEGGIFFLLIVESLTGLRLGVERPRFTPCLPAEWSTLAKATMRVF